MIIHRRGRSTAVQQRWAPDSIREYQGCLDRKCAKHPKSVETQWHWLCCARSRHLFVSRYRYYV